MRLLLADSKGKKALRDSYAMYAIWHALHDIIAA